VVADVVGVAGISVQHAAAADAVETLPRVLHRVLEDVLEGILAERILEGVPEGVQVLQRIFEHVVPGALQKIKIEPVLRRLAPLARRRELRRLGRLGTGGAPVSRRDPTPPGTAGLDGQTAPAYFLFRRCEQGGATGGDLGVADIVQVPFSR